MFAKVPRIAVIALFVASLFVPCGPCCAQQRHDGSECSAAYEDHNQTDYGPVKVNVIQGSSRIRIGDQTFPGAAGACLSLFTERDHRLVTIIKAGEYGSFDLGDVAPGRYRLLARAEGFCTANIPIRVVKSSSSRESGIKLGILVYFLPTGIDTCSYGEKLLLIDTKHTATAH
jgi:hypothetical protein